MKWSDSSRNRKSPRRSVAMTSPSDIPPDVARKIIAARDALITGTGGMFEAWHQLYMIASPEPNIDPWRALEKQAAKEAVDDKEGG